MSKIACSGSSGFIGSHLVKACEARGDQVFPISQDLLYDTLELRKFFDYHKPDVIYHLAAYGNLHKHTHPAKMIQANILGTFNMLRESSNVNYRAFVNVGTSSEYGKKSQPMRETDVLEPTTFYAATKAAATHLARAFSVQYKKPIITVRPFSVYGPGEPSEHFIPTLIQALLHGRLVSVEMGGMHDWIYIDDLIDGLLFAACNPDLQILNLGTGRETSNWDVEKLLTEIAGKKILGVATNDLRPHDSLHWVADLGASQKMTQENTRIYTGSKHQHTPSLYWNPKTSVQEGLQKTWAYYKELYDRQ